MHTLNRLAASLVGLLVANVAGGQIAARPQLADSSAARIMARVGSHSNAPAVRQILRQIGGSQPVGKLNELADSLALRAIAHRAPILDSSATRLAIDAVVTLILAGNPRQPEGVAYQGTLERLIRIHQESRVNSIRRRALGGMLAGSDRGRGIDYLRGIAEAKDSTAYDAVDLLLIDAAGGSWVGMQPSALEQQQSAQALKELVERNRVVDPRALARLNDWKAFERSQKR